MSNHNNDDLVRGFQEAIADIRRGLAETPFEGGEAETEIIGAISALGASLGRVSDALFGDDRDGKVDWLYEVDPEFAEVLIISGCVR